MGWSVGSQNGLTGLDPNNTPSTLIEYNCNGLAKYIGSHPPGSPESSLTWLIERLSYDSNMSVNKIETALASLSTGATSILIETMGQPNGWVKITLTAGQFYDLHIGDKLLLDTPMNTTTLTVAQLIDSTSVYLSGSAVDENPTISFDDLIVQYAHSSTIPLFRRRWDLRALYVYG